MKMTALAGAGLLVLSSVLGTACARDEGASVRSGAGGSSAAGGSSTASGSSSEASACRPVGEDLEPKAKTTVEVTLDDYEFTLSDDTIPAGITTFTVVNEGEHDHELAFLPGGGDVPLTDDGHPDEAAFEEAGVFELEAIPPGTECSATWDLEPGTYTVFCVVETDGKLHTAKGMIDTLTVT